MPADNSHPPAPPWSQPQDNQHPQDPLAPPRPAPSAAPPVAHGTRPAQPTFGAAPAPSAERGTRPAQATFGAVPVPAAEQGTRPAQPTFGAAPAWSAPPVTPAFTPPTASGVAAVPSTATTPNRSMPAPPGFATPADRWTSQAPPASGSPFVGAHGSVTAPSTAPMSGVPGVAPVSGLPPAGAGSALPPAVATSGVPFGAGVPVAAGAGRGRRGRVVAVVVVAVLAVVAAGEAAWALHLSSRLGAAERALAADRAADGDRLAALEGRADALEERVGSAFDAQAIAAAAVPSVFRVAAGPVTGTAWAVGGPAGGGDGGGRQVFLERRDARWPATIVKVDKDNDLAQLSSKATFPGLATAANGVQTGQQIAVVGAPLGLTDSVTTGVVSAMRPMDDSPGPLIQFSAPINPGNSGGPVINSAKQVVGVATAKAQGAEGIGLAVPVDVVCRLFPVC